VQLRAVVQNLLANALKFRREDVPARVGVAAERVGPHWRVEVTDNGLGIPPDRVDDVFEPFVRIDKTVPGTGIGLSTCRRIVEAHGGRIGVAEATGGGTTVWFLLPADPRPAEPQGADSVPV
jgi:signal transduction histidine kinase